MKKSVVKYELQNIYIISETFWEKDGVTNTPSAMLSTTDNGIVIAWNNGTLAQYQAVYLDSNLQQQGDIFLSGGGSSATSFGTILSF